MLETAAEGDDGHRLSYGVATTDVCSKDRASTKEKSSHPVEVDDDVPPTWHALEDSPRSNRDHAGCW
jgi:hypothetical protein